VAARPTALFQTLQLLGSILREPKLGVAAMGDDHSPHVGRWGRLRELIDEVDLFLRVSAVVGGSIATFVGWWSWVVGRLPWPAIAGIVIAVFATTIAALFLGALYYRQQNQFYFKTKSKDKDDVAGLLSTLERFWEIYHYAFSRDSQELSIALLTVPEQKIVNNRSGAKNCQ
jgi:hypothetical protein